MNLDELYTDLKGKNKGEPTQKEVDDLVHMFANLIEEDEENDDFWGELDPQPQTSSHTTPNTNKKASKIPFEELEELATDKEMDEFMQEGEVPEPTENECRQD